MKKVPAPLLPLMRNIKQPLLNFLESTRDYIASIDVDSVPEVVAPVEKPVVKAVAAKPVKAVKPVKTEKTAKKAIDPREALAARLGADPQLVEAEEEKMEAPQAEEAQPVAPPQPITPFALIEGGSFEYHVESDTYPNVRILKWLFAQNEYRSIDIQRRKDAVRIIVEGQVFPAEMIIRKNPDASYDMVLNKWSGAENYALQLQFVDGTDMAISGRRNWAQRKQLRVDGETRLNFPLPWATTTFPDSSDRDYATLAELWDIGVDAALEQETAARTLPAGTLAKAA